MKVLKYCLYIIIGLPVLLVVVALVLFLTIDPNSLKPRIEKTLASQGIVSDFAGDIGWRFFPSLGLSVEAVSLKNKAAQDLISVGVLDAGIELAPLLGKNIIVDSIVLRDTTLHYSVSANGKSNWDLIGGESTETEESAGGDEETANQNLNIESVDISNLSLLYTDKSTGENARVDGAFLRSQQINTEGKAFPITFGTKLALDNLPETAVSVEGKLAVNQAQKTLKILEGIFSVKPGNAAIDADLDFQMNWNTLAGEGALVITPTKLQPLFDALSLPAPRTQNPNAIKSLSGSAKFAFTDNSFSLADTLIAFDDFTLKGYAEVKAFQPLKVKSEWQGTAINLDHYLPPKTEEEKETETVESEPTELPIELIRDIADVDVLVNIDEVIISEIPIKNIQVTNKTRNGIALTKFKSRAADGAINANTKFDARGKQGKLNFDAKTDGIDIGKIFSAFTKKDHLQGAVNSNIKGFSSGATDTAMFDNLAFDAQVQSEKVTLTPINIEQEVCKAIAMVQKKSLPDYEWPQRTDLSPMTTTLKLSNQVLNVQSLQASIANLKASAEGALSLRTGKFEFPLDLRIGDFATQLEGCFPISEKWRNLTFPILCEGNLDGVDYKTCLPNTKKIGRLVEERLKNQAEAKIDKKKDEAKNKLKDKVKDKLGEEKTRELKGLFDTLRGKK